MKAAIYVRVSTRRQVEEGNSLEWQEKRCRAYADAQEWEVTKVYADRGVSGRRVDRPALTQLRSELDGVDRVIVWKMSRLGRSARDVLNAIADLQDGGLEVVFIDDNLDTSKATSRLLITILAAVAEMESENNAQQARAGMEEAATDGMWQGGPTPFGYTMEGGRLTLDEEQASTIRLAVSMILDGHSTQQVADHLNASERRPPRTAQWKSSELRRHLRRRSIKGEMEWDGIPLRFDPIINPNTYDRLQAVLDVTNLPRGTHQDIWVLSMRTQCSCGGYLIAGGRRQGKRRYRCSNHQGDQKGLCTCDHDSTPLRPRWWTADDIEREAWQSFVWSLHRKDALEDAIALHLGRNRDGTYDEATYQKVFQNTNRLRGAVIEAEADLYAATDRRRHQEVIRTLSERLDTAEADLARLEAIRTSQERADILRQKWLIVAERYVTFTDTDVPSPEEQQRIYRNLDVTFQIDLTPRRSGEIALSLSGMASKRERPEDAYVPFTGYIHCSGISLPSEVLLDGGLARPSP